MTAPRLTAEQFDTLIRAFRELVLLGDEGTHCLSHPALPIAVLLFVGEGAEAHANTALGLFESSGATPTPRPPDASLSLPWREDTNPSPGVN